MVEKDCGEVGLAEKSKSTARKKIGNNKLEFAEVNMKKTIIFVLMAICIWGISGCGNNDKSSETSSLQNNTQNEEVLNQLEEKSWSEQDIITMFSNIEKEEWVYKECVVISDYASGRVGAVLFQDNARGTSNVAFFDSEGYSQQCGTYAELADEPNFTYLGDGTVTFMLKTENGMLYNYTLTIFIDGNYVSFKTEDDLVK